MGAVAEWLVGGVSAAAEADNRPASQPEWLSFGIKNLKFAFDANGTVVIDGDLGGRHFFS